MKVWPITIKEAARRLKVRRETVSDLIRIHGLETEDVPYCGRAVGVGKETFHRLVELLTPEAAIAS